MNQKEIGKNRENEKGAALVMVLLVTSLLLVAVIGVLLEVGASSANITDAAAEQQAYNAAESGIQAAVDVLRAHTVPSPLLDTTKSSKDQSNRMTFARAIQLGSSNKDDDTSTDARLSRWMPYSTTHPDRVTIGNANDGTGYSITVTDPDNPTKIIELRTSTKIENGLLAASSSKTFNYALGPGSTDPFCVGATTTITYNDKTAAKGAVSVSAREISIDLGAFTVANNSPALFSTRNCAVSIPDTRFETTVELIKPLPATVILRGTIKAGTISKTASTVKVEYDSPAFNLLGSVISAATFNLKPQTDTNLSVTVTLTQPKRLVVRSVGYGPRGARKELEAIIERDVFDGLIPSTVALVGNTVGMVFNSGTGDQLVHYKGGDLTIGKLPPIGITKTGSGGLLSSATNLLSALTTGLTCPNCTVDGNPANVIDETPDWLKSPAQLNERIDEFKEIAKASNRYFTGGQAPTGGFGSADGTGITFIDGDANLTGIGGGLLVVTGKLNLQDAFNFNGTIIVTGKEGVKRTRVDILNPKTISEGTINGNLVVAPYNVADVLANASTTFLPPKYDVTGGGLSSLLYNTSEFLLGSNRVNTVVVGVAEK